MPSYAIVDFYLIYDGAVDCKYEPVWQEVSVEALILRWPWRRVGLTFNSKMNVSWIHFIHRISNWLNILALIVDISSFTRSSVILILFFTLTMFEQGE